MPTTQSSIQCKLQYDPELERTLRRLRSDNQWNFIVNNFDPETIFPGDFESNEEEVMDEENQTLKELAAPPLSSSPPPPSFLQHHHHPPHQ